LHCDADIASGAGRAVAVDQLEQRWPLVASEGQFAVQALQGFVDLGPVRFEVDRLDGWTFTNRRALSGWPAESLP